MRERRAIERERDPKSRIFEVDWVTKFIILDLCLIIKEHGSIGRKPMECVGDVSICGIFFPKIFTKEVRYINRTPK